MKIGEICCGKSLKENLSIDTTFNPSYFSWDSPFKIKKGKWQTRQFKIIYRLAPLSIPVICGWTVPLKVLSHEKWQGSKVVSIDRFSFKLLPEKISQIFIQPPSCFLHKTAQHHIIECWVIFLIEYPYGTNIFSVNGSQKLGQTADGETHFLFNGLYARHLFAEIVWTVKIIEYMAN